MWPRAGGAQAERDMVEALRRVEGFVFGETEGASRVVVGPPRVGPARPVVPPDRNASPGVRYLGYGIWDDKRVATPTALLPADNARMEVPLTLRVRPGDHKDAEVRRLLAEALGQVVGATVWAWGALGGIGSRSRKGYGAVQLLPGDRDLPWPEGVALPGDGAADAEALLRQVAAGIDPVLDRFSAFLSLLRTSGAMENLPEFGLEDGQGPHRRLRRLTGIRTVQALKGTFSGWEQALERAGRLMRDFRSTIRRGQLGQAPLPDYREVKRSLTDSRLPTDVVRASFGLPLPFYFRSIKGGRNRTEVLPMEGDRVPSPLIIRPHALEGGRLVVLLTHLAQAPGTTPMLDQDIRVRHLGRRRVQMAPDSRILDQFIGWAASWEPPAVRGGGER